MHLQHPSDRPDIAARHMATALAKAFAAGNPPGTAHLASGGVVLITGEPHPLGNFGIGMADDEVPEVARRLAETGLPTCLLFLCLDPLLRVEAMLLGGGRGLGRRLELRAAGG